MKSQRDYFEGDSMAYQKNGVIKKKEIFKNFLVTCVCMLNCIASRS
jgi:hypothetical protein